VRRAGILFLVWAAAGGLSCRAPKASSTGAAAPGVAPAPGTPERERGEAEIIALDGQIQEWRHEMGLGPIPRGPGADAPEPHWSRPRAPLSEQCESVCDLADYICDGKDKICRISRELGEDTWSKAKCESARTSCTEARKRCSDCR